LSPDYGDVEYEEIHKIFQFESKKVDRIYIKGLQKQRLIIYFMPHATVYELELLDVLGFVH